MGGRDDVIVMEEATREDGAADDSFGARDTHEDALLEDSPPAAVLDAASEASLPGDSAAAEAAEEAAEETKEEAEADTGDETGPVSSVSRTAQAGRSRTRRNTRKRYLYFRIVSPLSRFG
ncbi:MAG: hypothetical protein GX485_03420 [Clostridiales bacterium]|nr:hypothetical protein [Clostridiales bacterium]